MSGAKSTRQSAEMGRWREDSSVPPSSSCFTELLISCQRKKQITAVKTSTRAEKKAVPK